jgi:hypothetical protein
MGGQIHLPRACLHCRLSDAKTYNGKSSDFHDLV